MGEGGSKHVAQALRGAALLSLDIVMTCPAYQQCLTLLTLLAEREASTVCSRLQHPPDPSARPPPPSPATVPSSSSLRLRRLTKRAAWRGEGRERPSCSGARKVVDGYRQPSSQSESTCRQEEPWV